ncbi:unnamed protein product [Orchesella dallaii]|uniref:Uncharacterized protein n=1 Tax=Orchesella dallaii TaxID=48710 RepID=A0ABP1RG49_9HEXA
MGLWVYFQILLVLINSIIRRELIYANIFSPPQITEGEKGLVKVFNECIFNFQGYSNQWTEKLLHFASKVPVTIKDTFKFKIHWRKHRNRRVFHIHNASSPSSISTGKHTVCIMKLLYWMHSDYPFLFSKMLESPAIKEKLIGSNPNYIIFMFNSKIHLVTPGAKLIKMNLMDLSVTSIPIIVTDLSGTMLCIYCNDYEDYQDIFNTADSPKEIKQIWKASTKNLNGKTMHFNQQHFRMRRKHACSMLHVQLYSHPPLCTIMTLSLSYNFTIFGEWGSHGRHLIGDVETGPIMSSAAIHNIFLKRGEGSNKLGWIHYGCEYNPYKFMLFMSTEHAVNFRALLQPFDNLSTAMFILSIICTLLFLHAVVKTYNEDYNLFSGVGRQINDFQYKCILEQSDPKTLALFSESISGYLGVSFWLFSCYAIGNEYKGFMYSCMTTFPNPRVPESITDLVMHSSIPYYTTTKHVFQGDLYSTLKDMVLADFLHNKKQTYGTKVIEKLRQKCALIKGSEATSIFNITKQLPVLSDAGMIIIPPKFALISSEGDVKLFVTLIRKLSDLIIITSNKVSYFESRVPWYGNRNTFLKIFTEGLSKLEQSGIYRRWSKHFSLYLVVEKFIEIDENLKRLNVTTSNQTNYFSRVLYAFSDSGLNMKVDDIRLRVQNLELMLIGCCGIVVAATIALGCELLVYQVKENSWRYY